MSKKGEALSGRRGSERWAVMLKRVWELSGDVKKGLSAERRFQKGPEHWGLRGHSHFLASQNLNFGHWTHTSAFFNDEWSKIIFSRNFEAIEIHKFWGPETTFAEPRKYLIARCTLTASFSYHDALLQQAIYSTMTHALLQKSIYSTMTHALLQLYS